MKKQIGQSAITLTADAVYFLKKFTRIALPVAASLFTLSAPFAHADDIEIYNSRNTQEVDKFDPNLLFVLDTSGSMRTPEAIDILAGGVPYDPKLDYGEEGLDENYYVYTSDNVYTGLSVPASGNSCKASLEHISETPGNPAYFGQILGWQYRGEVDVPVERCTSGQTLFGTVNANSNYSRYSVTGTLATSEGVEVEASYDSRVAGRIYIAFYDENGDWISSGCNGNNYRSIDRLGTKTCKATAPFGATSFRARFQRRDGRARRGTRVEATLSTPESCETVIETLNPDADWTVISKSEEHATVALECSEDSGVHGISDGNSAKFPVASNAATIAETPRYASNASQAGVINWSDEEKYPYGYIYSGNYHDYLQSSPEELVDLGTATINDLGTYSNVKDYCQYEPSTINFPNANDYVRDNEGNVYRCTRRIESLKVATKLLLEGLNGVRVGMARFNTTDGGSLLVEVDDLDKVVSDVDGDHSTTDDQVTHRDVLLKALDRLPAQGATPLQESLYTAYTYYAGLSMVAADVGAQKNIVKPGEEPQPSGEDDKYFPRNIVSTHLSQNPTNSYTGTITYKEGTDRWGRRIMVADSVGTYISPIQNVCQDNSLVLFSDGEATSDKGRKDEIEAVGGECKNLEEDGGALGSGDCLDELAGGMAKKKVYSELEGDNFVYTYTIGFGSDLNKDGANQTTGTKQLIAAADAGKRPTGATSQYYSASSTQTLLTAFNDIIKSLGNLGNDTFVSPAVAVNAFNRLQYRDDLYYAVFEPQQSKRWYGNVKKYKLDADGNIVDATGTALTLKDGFFPDTAKSYWSDVVDGTVASKGGAAGELVIDPERTIYASLDIDAGDTSLHGTGDDKVVKLARDTFATQVGAIPIGNDVNIADNYQQIVDWTFGVDVGVIESGKEVPNYFLGDVLHGTPYALDYGTANAQRDVVFSTTNQGMLHAVKGDTGEELFAYIPDPSLFMNLGDYYNDVSSEEHTYGIDGEMTFDVVRDPKTDELKRANIFVGQRRGGDKIFALDVKNAYSDNPSKRPIRKLWTKDSSDLPNLGQTWAKPVLAKINYCPTNCTEDAAPTEVLVVSGGYDSAYDTHKDDSTDPATPVTLDDIATKGVKGNSIYILERSTGNLLWAAGKSTDEIGTSVPSYYVDSNMKHSFPSEPVVVDANFDGVADFMYAIDISGKIWRFDFVGGVETVNVDGKDITKIDGNDIVEGNTKDKNEVAAGVIADLGKGQGDARFYNKVDVSLFPRKSQDEPAKFVLSVGSGYRAHPLVTETQVNRWNFVYDENVRFPKFLDKQGNDDLPDAISYDYHDSNREIEAGDLPIRGLGAPTSPADSKYGFALKLEQAPGEKLLNATITDEAIVSAVSYAPPTQSQFKSCGGAVGSSYLYQLDLGTGTSAVKKLAKGGIGTGATFVQIAEKDANGEIIGTSKVLIIGTETFGESEIGENGFEGPGLDKPKSRKSRVGDINKVNWWERRGK